MKCKSNYFVDFIGYKEFYCGLRPNDNELAFYRYTYRVETRMDTGEDRVSRGPLKEIPENCAFSLEHLYAAGDGHLFMD